MMKSLAAVAPGLFLSAAVMEQEAEALKLAGITHILQVGAELKPSHPDSFTYLSIPIRDFPWIDIVSQFPAAFSFIDAAVDAGGAALVHCMAGVSRSATIVIGYQLYKHKLSLEEALVATLKARRIILPNPGFICQLLEYEQMGCDVTNWSGWDGDRWLEHPLAAKSRDLHRKVMRGGRDILVVDASRQCGDDGDDNKDKDIDDAQVQAFLLSRGALDVGPPVSSSDSPFAQLLTAAAAAGDDEAAAESEADSSGADATAVVI